MVVHVAVAVEEEEVEVNRRVKLYLTFLIAS